MRAYVEAEAGRVSCPEHGVVVAVPWARHDAGHTYSFDDTIAWLAVACSKSAVTVLMRIAWRTVRAIVKRVCADVDAVRDRFAALARIGIDEISYKNGHQYLTVVVDHDPGRLVWTEPGRDRDTLRAFFDVLGPDRLVTVRADRRNELDGAPAPQVAVSYGGGAGADRTAEHGTPAAAGAHLVVCAERDLDPVDWADLLASRQDAAAPT